MSAHNCDGAHGPCPHCTNELEAEIEARRRRDEMAATVCHEECAHLPANPAQVATLTAERDALIAQCDALERCAEDRRERAKSAERERDALKARMARAVGLLRGLPFPFPEWPEIKAFLADDEGKG